MERRIAYRLDTAREEGEKKGKAEGKIEVAKNLLKAGVSINIIAESTGLPKTEIAQFKKEVTS